MCPPASSVFQPRVRFPGCIPQPSLEVYVHDSHLCVIPQPGLEAVKWIQENDKSVTTNKAKCMTCTVPKIFLKCKFYTLFLKENYCKLILQTIFHKNLYTARGLWSLHFSAFKNIWNHMLDPRQEEVLHFYIQPSSLLTSYTFFSVRRLSFFRLSSFLLYSSDSSVLFRRSLVSSFTFVWDFSRLQQIQ